jgi:hypothetical protein
MDICETGFKNEGKDIAKEEGCQIARTGHAIIALNVIEVRSMSESDVARWHRLSGLPDNVTEDGEIVRAEAGRRASEEKAQMRAEIARIRDMHPSEEARNLAKLAASYLLAGDAETARRYLDRANGIQRA